MHRWALLESEQYLALKKVLPRRHWCDTKILRCAAGAIAHVTLDGYGGMIGLE